MRIFSSWVRKTLNCDRRAAFDERKIFFFYNSHLKNTYFYTVFSDGIGTPQGHGDIFSNIAENAKCCENRLVN